MPPSIAWSTLSALIPLLIAIYAVYSLVSGKLRCSRLPPGPSGWPLIGNMFDVPRGPTIWIEYREMCKKYKSDIVYLNVLGKPMVVLNTLEAATELLERRSAIYSDRPRFVMLRELMGGDTFSSQPYGSYWRSHRRLFHSEFEASGKGTIWHHPYQIRNVNETLRRLLESPERWPTHLRQQAAAMVLEVAYGFRALPENDPYIRLAEGNMAYVIVAGTGKYLVEIMPWLKYVPAWFPGASFQTVAKEARKVMSDAIEVPFEAVQKALANNTANPSYTSRCLENVDPNKDIAFQHLVIKNTAGTMLGAGTETTLGTFHSFIMAMVLYPDVQAKAQRELDAVLGPNQLPSFADQDSLPYLTALVKELLRWEPLLPFAVPHRSTKDDVYNGYLIPAGTIIYPNSWAILNDENVYPDPETFNPDRFLTEDGKPDPSVRDTNVAFGYGRRICPGRFMVLESVWLTAASILACYKIESPVDEHGNEVKPARDYYTNIVRQPVPFSCRFTPRSKETEKIIGDLFISSE
ncbi:cytochrome P450 [Athelia psychrophila]|uniref:Cytochrome P450 n=1 Tax=Athelia psychrophila TaxID=1759441 RepID=A0A166K5P6_9AGAM|nr:cytochrome P450 [Fibularhizoctonia sp. CBS 109695]